MQLKSLRISYKFLQSKYYIITLSMVLLSSTFILDPQLDAFAQQQQEAGSLVNSICQLVQDNSLISTLVGLDQALNICNNLNSIGSNQALSELCSTIGDLNVINIDTYCNQHTSIQTQLLNESNKIPDSQDNMDSNPNETVNPASNSIIDRILGLFFGFLNF
jgi:hypothetical protein